jgi:SAM-dependent methyltransferase
VNKLGEARWLLDKLEAYEADFAAARSILELGAGQGWATCIVKRLFPDAKVVASDLSPDALASAETWVEVIGAAPDATVACRSSEIPYGDESFDLVFCFQSAHHFGPLEPTLSEARRLLAPGGVALFLHEPSCQRYVHRLAARRVRARRQAAPEDVLVYTEVERLGREAGFDVRVRFDPTRVNRQPLETVYYAALSAVPSLQGLLPCTADYSFRKPARAPALLADANAEELA